jgi:uncharacterized protein (TIGR02678 family)
MEVVAGSRELQSAGLAFDTGNYDHRRDLVQATRVLLDWDVLRSRGGNEQDFINQNDQQVYYEINRRILASVMHVSHSPSVVEASAKNSAWYSIAERAKRLVDERRHLAEDSRNQFIRARLMRALLDDPVLYFHDLSDEERNYLDKNRGYLLRRISEATGLTPEVRREGIAMVDASGDFTDLKLPDEGTSGYLDFRLAQWFGECAKAHPDAPIPISAVAGHVQKWVRFHASEWSIEDALFRLRALRLIRVTETGFVPLPACARYASTTTGSPDR